LESPAICGLASILHRQLPPPGFFQITGGNRLKKTAALTGESLFGRQNNRSSGSADVLQGLGWRWATDFGLTG